MDSCVLQSRHNIPKPEERQKVFAGFLLSGWGKDNREAWQELTVSLPKAMLNDFRLLCLLKLCVSKTL